MLRNVYVPALTGEPEATLRCQLQLTTRDNPKPPMNQKWQIIYHLLNFNMANQLFGLLLDCYPCPNADGTLQKNENDEATAQRLQC
jgi:hypothetical protein